MEKVYNPAVTEAKWYKWWEENGLFHSRPNSERRPYTIVIPPPNVTGMLTIGHVLNNTLQDILIRWKRMEGCEALWMPGTDHAGIATQNVVEQTLAKEDKTRHQLGRERFVERVWQWKQKYGGIIIQQLKMLGCSCDWERERFTMDEVLSRAVREAFVQLYEKGLIYRGKYIVNWCPRCQTALSDEESVHQEEKGFLWYIKYPLKDEDKYITVATTRPETMLGDTAVAVNPNDERYLALVGKTLILPLVDREIPIVADEFVDPEFGTGAVKVTPAHDPDDFEIAGRHKLPQMVIMNKDATMNEMVGPDYQGMDRYQCREKLLEDLRAQKLLVKAEDYTYSVSHCERCGTVLEPYLSDQWFVKMRPLAASAIEAVETGELRFFPGHWVKTYLHWLENIKDWCISRQLWWGHRIPIWYCQCGHQFAVREDPQECPRCGGKNLTQDEDVLDTWFSSWLWPFSTMGWPQNTPELRYFYPTNALVTAPDIIFLWVARMVMAGCEFMGECPFRDVYFTSLVRDLQGSKMSKSLGNSPDPTQVMKQFGADALRFTMTMLSPQGQDVYYSNEKVELGRNFCNKIWNAARFVLSNLPEKGEGKETKVESGGLELADRWILSRLNQTIRALTNSLQEYRFDEAAHCIYDFFWHEYCDWYLELIKPRLYQSSAEKGSKSARRLTAKVLRVSMQLLHPFMPFITEEIWYRLNARENGTSIMVSPWPQCDQQVVDETAERDMSLLQELVVAIRNIRAEMNVPPDRKADVMVRVSGKESLRLIRNHEGYITNLAKVQNLCAGPEVNKPHQHCATAVVKGMEVFVPLAGLIDLGRERERLEREVERLSEELERLSGRLEDGNFLKKAPAEVVKKERQKHLDCRENLEKLLVNLRALGKVQGSRGAEEQRSREKIRDIII